MVSHGKFGSHDNAFCKNNHRLVQPLTFRPRLNSWKPVKWNLLSSPFKILLLTVSNCLKKALTNGWPHSTSILKSITLEKKLPVQILDRDWSLQHTTVCVNLRLVGLLPFLLTTSLYYFTLHIQQWLSKSMNVIVNIVLVTKSHLKWKYLTYFFLNITHMIWKFLYGIILCRYLFILHFCDSL